MAIAVAFPLRATADDTTPAAYRQAVEATLALVRGAQPNDTDVALKAVNTLKLAGVTQPEILADLQQTPPEFEDAARRLQALLNALTVPADTTDPAQAKLRLDEVLAMPRYDALHRPPSLLDRLRQWVSDRISQLLNAMRHGAGPSSVPDYVLYAIGAIVVAVVAILIFRATRGRFSEGARSARSAGPRAPADYFAEADRLAAAGDRVGAIRALCAGVAATLAGERTWEGSPTHSPRDLPTRP